MMVKVKKKHSTSADAALNPTIIDAASLFDACDAIAERVGRAKVTLDYAKLRERLDHLRDIKWGARASTNMILLSVDPHSEGQQRFQAMLKHAGFVLDVVHYRDTFISAPPGRSFSEIGAKPITSFATRIAYIAGLLARQEKQKSGPQVLIVTHSFELLGPLTNLATRLENGKVGIAYFGSLLDYRWKASGLFEREYNFLADILPGRAKDEDMYISPENKIGLKFFDLDPHCQELLGIDLVATSRAKVSTNEGLSLF